MRASDKNKDKTLSREELFEFFSKLLTGEINV